jgi:hypothetical protein
MAVLAIRTDRIITGVLASLPPGNLTFERAHTPNLITYTLRINQIEVGFIEIESIPISPLTTLLIFSIVQSTAELILEIKNLNDLIMESIVLATGKGRWKEVTAELDPQLPYISPLARPSLLAEQKIFADSAHYPKRKRQPWEAIPNHLWDRLAVELWCDGYSSVEIALRVKVQPRSVTNRISELRRLYPQAGIPTRSQRKKLMLQDNLEEDEMT